MFCYELYFLVYIMYILQIFVILTMLCEAIIMLASGDSPIGVTRALRPLFLLDIIMLQDVRRYKYIGTYMYCICKHIPTTYNEYVFTCILT